MIKMTRFDSSGNDVEYNVYGIREQVPDEDLGAMYSDLFGATVVEEASVGVFALRAWLVFLDELTEYVALEHPEVLECEVCGYPPSECDQEIHDAVEYEASV